MDPDNWQRLESVFFAALELTPDERDSYLDRACAGDAQLRAEVDAVLAAHVAAAGQDPPAFTEEPPSPGLPAGTRISAYRLEELVARGGMGEVYRAQRVDDQYQQEVAVKVVRAGLGGEEMVRRFRVERQILARLQHPNIAALLDGGVTPDGQPFLVMQYVRGVPITVYADRMGLSLRDRLELFRTVCEAVQYAHANLVVHRDLKPSNILVTAEGQVRLLDFGIAKLLAAEGADVLTDVTGDMLLLTPEHAAPEQLRGSPVTTATDVYALGILLYELLTGARPFYATSPVELVQAVCEREPTRPSAVVLGRSADASSAGSHARPLARQLRGDLDHIVLRALRKEPERRYASAGQFAEDMTRFLEGRPVLARPDTVGYRIRKFVFRNRTAAALAALAALSLLGGLLGTTSQARRARTEALQAAADRDRAERVSGLLVDMFRLSDPTSTRGRTVTAREVLDQGAARIARDLAGQPEPQADLLTEVAQIYENLGLFDDAATHLERALALRRSVFGDDHPRVAESLTRLAHVRTQQGMAEEAVALARTATTMLRRRDDSRSRSALADALLALGDALRRQPLLADASAAYAESLSLLQQQTGDDDARIAHAFFGWSDAAHNQGQFDLADSLLQETVTRHARRGSPPHPDAAASLNNLGMLRMYRRRAADAEPLLRQALDMRRRIFGDVHPAVAETLSGLSQALSLLGRFAEAADVGAEAVAVSDSALGRDHPSSAEVRIGLGFILLKLDRGEQALRVMEEAKLLLQGQLAPADPRLLGMDITIGQAFASMGRFDRARAAYDGALGRIATALGPDHPYRAHVLLELARLDFDDERLDDAEAKANASLELTRRVLRPDHRFALWSTLVVAKVRAARGQLLEADSLLRSVLATQRATLGDAHPETAVTLVAVADLETRLGRLADAETHARSAVSIFAASHERGPILAEARSVLGAAIAARGRTAEAEPLLRGALQELADARGARRDQLAAADARLRRFTRKP